MTVNGNILTADEGKLLTNGDTYSSMVYLSKLDSVDNWTEIDEQEIETEE